MVITMVKKLSMSNKTNKKSKKTKSIDESTHTFNALFSIIIFLSAGCIGVTIALLVKHFLSFN